MQLIIQSCLLFMLADMLVNAEEPSVFVAKPTRANFVGWKANSVILRCQDYEPVIHKVAWLKGSQVLFAGEDKWTLNQRVSLVNLNSSDYSIQIDWVQPSDQGDYSCSFHVNNKQHVTKLHLTVPAGGPSVFVAKSTRPPHGIAAFKGERIILRCQDSEPDIHKLMWLKGSEPLFIGEHKFTSNQRMSLANRYRRRDYSIQIDPVQQTDQGEYSCSFHVNDKLHVTMLHLTVHERLFRPNITVSGVSEGQQQRVEEGSSFSIVCSIRPQYPGGSFQLTHTGANARRSRSYTQPAVGHSSTFLFPAANHTHQGNYSCVYHVDVDRWHLSSESGTLSLTITPSSTDIFFNLFRTLISLI